MDVKVAVISDLQTRLLLRPGTAVLIDQHDDAVNSVESLLLLRQAKSQTQKYIRRI